MDGEVGLPVNQVSVGGGANHYTHANRVSYIVSSGYRTGNVKAGYSLFIGIITGIVTHLISFTAVVEGLALVVVRKGQRIDIRPVTFAQTIVG